MGNIETWDTILNVHGWYLGDKELIQRLEKAKVEVYDDFVLSLDSGRFRKTAKARIGRGEENMLLQLKKVKDLKSDLNTIGKKVFKKIDIDNQIYKNDKCVADLDTGDFVCTIDVDTDAVDFASRFAYLKDKNRKLHSIEHSGDTYWTETRSAVNDDKRQIKVSAKYDYKQVVSAFGQSGFIIERETLELPEVRSSEDEALAFRTF